MSIGAHRPGEMLKLGAQLVRLLYNPQGIANVSKAANKPWPWRRILGAIRCWVGVRPGP
jgi:hypothetical protein